MFFSLAELNEAIREKLELLNDRPMQKLKVSRRDLYEQIDRPALRPLPSQRYEIAEWSCPKVSIDYHVEVDHNFYSVPFSLLHERLDARATATTVEIFFKARRVASHCRLRGKNQYATLPEHMPAAHRAHLEWSPSRLVQWAEKTGPATAEIVAHILQHRPHPEQGYRAAMGIMRLGTEHGAERLEAAARRALYLRAYSYHTVKNILSAGTDRLPLDPDTESKPTCLPAHDNIRGAAYYAAKEISC